ncbi:MAG TPA: oligopeptide transporter, OPT family, partial [Gemmatimonas sp.]|nr:oligopeptide transporter, OPT family [Gemmatimonas sp.]
PGLVIVGWWTGFPFWQSFLICASGGVLGVLFTIPLRRALVTNSDLPYPEGVAAAEVLKVGSSARGEGVNDASEAREGLTAVALGTAASAGLAILGATRVIAAELGGVFRLGATAASGYSIAWSLALFGAGHLVGLSVGLAMLTGLLIAWAVAVPVLTSLAPAVDAASLTSNTMTIWRTQVRFIGAGAIGVSAIFTLAMLARPVFEGLVSTLRSSQRSATAGDDRDRDIGPTWIIGLTVVCLLVTGWLAWGFARDSALAPSALALTALAVPFVLVVGFLIAGVAGYMAGLIGASNSPISGIGILAIVICASLVAMVVSPTVETRSVLVAFALFVTSIVFACATISNDNLQDLKTGQLVGASPMKQQIALIVGVLAGAAVISPVLNLLAKAYGFAGAPNIGVLSENALPAPQATLISALAQGVIGGNLDWGMIGIGAVVGVALIVINAILKATGRGSLPPLAVGIGIYLPMSATFAVVVGAAVGHWYNKRALRSSQPTRAERLGTLVASGLIVGESLFGVLTAGLIVATANDAPLALVGEDFAPARILGLVGFVLLVVGLYRWMLGRVQRA